MSKNKRLLFYEEIKKRMDSAEVNKTRSFDPIREVLLKTIYGFCSIINDMEHWCGENDIKWGNPYEYMHCVAPELYRKKPLFIDDRSLEQGYWFRNTPAGWEARVNLIDEVIAEIKGEIENELAENTSTENN